MLQKVCHGQNAESQAGSTSKDKLTNIYKVAGSKPDISQYPKLKTARRQSLQIFSWAEV